MRWAIGLLAAGCLSATASAAPLAAPTASLSDWAAVVVSGDDQAAHVRRPTAAFDNARRDVAAAFERRGVAAANLAEISVRDDGPDGEAGVMRDQLDRLAGKAKAGCLLYVTSHGSPDGVLVGDRLVSPRVLARIVGGACPGRPTAVILSACFSGVFVPALSSALGARGFVLTAARRDRSSFGCGEGDRYPFFDGCVLQVLPDAVDFVQMADRVRLCVARREDDEHMRPRSEPQVFIGSAFKGGAEPFPSVHGGL